MVGSTANQLTILRMVFVPVFILLLVYGRIGAAIGVFFLAGVTDLLDGFIARRFEQKTALGIFLDPMADKLLLTSAFITLSLDSLPLIVTIPLWLTITVISRDILLVTSVVVINLTAGRHLFPPTQLGKWTTVVQLLLVMIVLAGNWFGAEPPFFQPAVFITLLLTVTSGIHYLYRGMRILGHQTNEPV